MHIKCDHEHLGFIIENGIRGWKCKFAGGYIIQINDTPVFTQEVIENALSATQEALYTQDKPLIKISIAPDNEHTLQQHMSQIHI
eukprot:7516766-Ditylum_brightwellii.AAC.1